MRWLIVSGQLLLFLQSDIRHFPVDERILLAFIVSASKTVFCKHVDFLWSLSSMVLEDWPSLSHLRSQSHPLTYSYMKMAKNFIIFRSSIFWEFSLFWKILTTFYGRFKHSKMRYIIYFIWHCKKQIWSPLLLACICDN